MYEVYADLLFYVLIQDFLWHLIALVLDKTQDMANIFLFKG